jgi:hypothetical protein
MIEIACIILILLLDIALLYKTFMSKRCRKRFWETVFENVPNYLYSHIDSEYNHVFYPDLLTAEVSGLDHKIIILLSAKTKSTKILDYRDSSWLATEKTDPTESKELYRRLYERYAFRILDINFLKKDIRSHLNGIDRITMIPVARIFKKYMSLDLEKRKSIIGSSWYNGESELNNSIRYFWKCMSEESLSTLWTQLRQLNRKEGKSCFTL